jgi:hypothetical protein
MNNKSTMVSENKQANESFGKGEVLAEAFVFMEMYREGDKTWLMVPQVSYLLGTESGKRQLLYYFMSHVKSPLLSRIPHGTVPVLKELGFSNVGSRYVWIPFISMNDREGA